MAASASAAAADDCQLDLLAGGVLGDSQHIHSSGTPITSRFDLKGRAAGVGLGCLWYRHRWATGFAADVMHTTGKGRGQDQAPFFNPNFVSETSVDWIGTARLVVGYRSGSGMLYLTAGGAAAPFTAKVCPVGAPNAFCAIQTQTLYGLTGGFGAEWRFARHWSVKSEFLAFVFEKRAFFNPPPAGFADRGGGLQPELQLARVGLAFHF